VGFPVVLKALGEKFLHKSDLGAVKLNLSNAAAVAHAVSEITSSAGESGQEVARFLVEPMTTDAVAELIVGVKRDEQFGPALVIGSGGILVELVADSVSLLLPTNRDEIRGAILNLSVARLLDGYRGSPRGDMEALIDAILAVADYAEAHWDVLEELDVNPLLVLPEGEGVVAVDAMIVHR
jgi:succinyl-CoA synthetase beta subunit